MKYFFFLIIASLFSETSVAQTGDTGLTKSDSTLYYSLKAQNLIKYKGKSIKKLLKNKIVSSFSCKRYIDGGRIGQLAAVVFEFEKNVRLFIEIESFKHVSAINKDRNWDFNLVKREKIKSVEIFISN
jgi:hypothetical protein